MINNNFTNPNTNFPNTNRNSGLVLVPSSYDNYNRGYGSNNASSNNNSNVQCPGKLFSGGDNCTFVQEHYHM